jgi:hypothetical protein
MGFGKQLTYWSMNQGVSTIPQDTYTKLLYHFDGDTTDYSQYGHNGTLQGSATLNTPAKFGASSLVCTNTGDYVDTADSDDWFYGTGDFTIDLWFRTTSSAATSKGLVHQIQNGTNFITFMIYQTGGGYVLFNSQTGGVNDMQIATQNGAFNYNTNQWYHIAIVRSGVTGWYIFIDGVSKAVDLWSGSWSGNISNNTGNLSVGNPSQGYTTNDSILDEVRISKGIARWTSNFTPPTAPY